MAVLLEELQAGQDVNIHALVLRRGLEQDVEFERLGGRFHVLKLPRVPRTLSLFWPDTLVLRRAVRRIQPDLVHAWGSERGCGLIASRLGVPWLMTIQGLLTWYRERIPMGGYEKLLTRLEHVSLRRASVATTESTFAVEFLRQRYPALSVRQVEHAPNRAFHQCVRRPQLRPIRFITGSLSIRKGSDLLLRALNRLRAEMEFELIVVGGRNQPLLDSLKDDLSPELEQRIHYRSDLSPSQVADELATATIMVLPTRADTSPNSIKEAVVAGVPVVASRVGGIPDYVVPEKNGLLTASESVEELIASLRAACAHPLFSRGNVDTATWQQMREYLSPALMAGRFVEAYQLALAQHGHNHSPASRQTNT